MINFERPSFRNSCISDEPETAIDAPTPLRAVAAELPAFTAMSLFIFAAGKLLGAWW